MKIPLVFTKIGTLSLVFLLCLLCLQSDGADIAEGCTVDGNCTNTNGACIDSKCDCVTTHYDNGSVCTQKVILNKLCTSDQPDNQCVDTNAECVVQSGTTELYKCLCNSQYYANSTEVCAKKKLPGGSCTTAETTTECLDSNSTCTAESDDGGNKCRCTTGYYDSDLDDTNVGGTCTPKVILDAVCTSGQPDNQCIDTNAECVVQSGTTELYKCLCNSQYYANTTQVCAKKSVLGEVCFNEQPANQCSVINSECFPSTIGGSDYRCICMASYYRDEQECKSLTELQVQNLDIPDDTTGETCFVVTWDNPPTDNFIDKYQLILEFDNQSESPVDIDRTSVSFNITDRVPGRTYTIILRSVETQTRPKEQTIDVVIIDGTRPAIPGAITQNVFNGPTINISWNIAGDLEYLKGTINDTSASPSTFNLTFASQLPLSVTNLRHGDKYTFTVTAHSNGFSSAAYSQTIRTTPTRPPPPTEFECIDSSILDKSMTLTWKEPTVPNGYIQNYTIHDMTRNMQIATNGSVLKQLIVDLSPETKYNLTIKTVNDAGTSNSSSLITCLTKPALSSPPQNVVSSAITSNKITVQWDYPQNPGGVLWGYRITVRNGTNDSICVQEIIFQCVNGCPNAQNLGFKGSCDSKKILNASTANMLQTMSHDIEDLLPYVNYKIIIQAVNAKGEGHFAEVENTTLEEAPKKPLQVTGVPQSDPKPLQVTWQQPLPRPGITTYTVKVYEENDDATEFVYKKNFTEEIPGYYTQTATITGLEEYWNYKFVIVATTSIGSVKSDMSTVVRTRHSAPGEVDNFMIENPSEIYNQMNVMWSIPPIRKRNSVIMKYVISHNISGNMESLNVTESSDSFMKTFNVTAEQWYEVEVYAVNTQDQEGPSSNKIYYAKPGPPKTPPVDAVIESTSDPATTQTTIKLKFESSWFLNTDNGMRTDGGVMVCQESKCTGYGNSSQEKFVSHFRNITWKKSKTGGFEKPYRVTNSSWVEYISATSGRRKRSTKEIELIIGEDGSCDKKDDNIFCNGPLPAGTSLSVVAFVCTNGGCTESQHFGPYSTQAIPDGSQTGIIAGAVAAVVVVIIVIVIIAVFVMHRRNRQKPKEKELDDKPMGPQAPSVKRTNIQTNKQKPTKKLMDNAPVPVVQSDNRPIVMEDFERTVEYLHKDSNLKFAHEYEELKTLTNPKTLKGVTTNLAETEEHKLKNRYVNILPYDESIVPLASLADDDENATTFINANYIPGYRSQREYIASQGPIPSTIDDFWRMIWEQSVAIVVMLTLCKEKGRIKCECYWPTDLYDTKRYWDIVVELTSFSNFNTYEISEFKLTMGDTTRYVKHFHFLNWNDFSANVQNDVMIDFIHNVRSHVRISESKVPMIVHCSAGVGRTGTYIAIDHLMQFVNDHDFSKSIDIFNIVVKMRQCRMFMVQTEQQYIFIYDCIRDILERKRLREQQSNEENLYENPNVKEEDLYANNDFIYENKAFVPEPEADLIYNDIDLQSTEERSDL